jgi:hypothetical protein
LLKFERGDAAAQGLSTDAGLEQRDSFTDRQRRVELDRGDALADHQKTRQQGLTWTMTRLS